MFLSLLFSNPLVAVAWSVAALFSLSVHECSHALVAKWRGDKTGEWAGRLTLNPLAHLDPLGTIPLILFAFGWAKPVPYNPYNLRDPKWDSVRVGLAGPMSNLIVAAAAGVLLRLIIGMQWLPIQNMLVVFLLLLMVLNLSLLFFNIIPIHPLDGSKLFFALFDAPKYARLRQIVAVHGPNVLFALVLISLLTNIDAFFFISLPSFATCNALLGENCGGLLGAIFGG